jgi:hypothetical protein
VVESIASSLNRWRRSALAEAQFVHPPSVLKIVSTYSIGRQYNLHFKVMNDVRYKHNRDAAYQRWYRGDGETLALAQFLRASRDFPHIPQ